MDSTNISTDKKLQVAGIISKWKTSNFAKGSPTSKGENMNFLRKKNMD
jgi:hypothetical protein